MVGVGADGARERVERLKQVKEVDELVVRDGHLSMRLENMEDEVACQL